MQPVVDVHGVLDALALERRVFHSEADFQFAFGWKAKELDPSLQVRLETQPVPKVRLDLHVWRPDLGQHMAIELKYLTRKWQGQDAGQTFGLSNQGASDIRCYDVVKDIGRVEWFVRDKPDWTGCCVTLSNDAVYWRASTHGRATNADSFRISEGLTLSGTRGWGPLTGAGTSEGRTNAITLRESYVLKWRDFSTLDGSTAGTFRALVVPVSP